MLNFFLLGSSALTLWPLTWVNISSLALILILSMVENPLSIDSIQGNVTGLKDSACRYCINSGSD